MPFDPSKLIYDKQCYPEYYFNKFPYKGPLFDSIRQSWADEAKATNPLEQLLIRQYKGNYNLVIQELKSMNIL